MPLLRDQASTAIARMNFLFFQVSHEPRGHARDQSVWSDVFGDDRPRSDDRSSTDSNARKDDRARADPGPVADFDWPLETRSASLKRRTQIMIHRDEHHFVTHIDMAADADGSHEVDVKRAGQVTFRTDGQQIGHGAEPGNLHATGKARFWRYPNTEGSEQHRSHTNEGMLGKQLRNDPHANFARIDAKLFPEYVQYFV